MVTARPPDWGSRRWRAASQATPASPLGESARTVTSPASATRCSAQEAASRLRSPIPVAASADSSSRQWGRSPPSLSSA